MRSTGTNGSCSGGSSRPRDGTRGAKRWPHDTKASLNKIRALLTPAAGQGWQPDLSYGKHAKEAWVILFEDAEVKPEVFIGEGAEQAARHRFKKCLLNWNCHLLCTAAAPAIANQEEGK